MWQTQQTNLHQILFHSNLCYHIFITCACLMCATNMACLQMNNTCQSLTYWVRCNKLPGHFFPIILNKLPTVLLTQRENCFDDVANTFFHGHCCIFSTHFSFHPSWMHAGYYDSIGLEVNTHRTCDSIQCCL